MEPIGAALARALGDTNPSSTAKLLSDRLKAWEQLSPEERETATRKSMQEKVDRYNATPGKLRDGYTTSNIHGDNQPVAGDGYDCPLCLNRGDTLALVERNGTLYEVATECKCMTVRRSIWRMRQSGLENSIRENTFKRFEAREPWQRKMLDMALRYVAEGWKDGRWLFIGGQPGSGKTHICTAIAGKLLYEKPLLYVVWPQISKKLKALVTDAEEYEQEINKVETVHVLYIDDLFKPVMGDNGEKLPPTPADVKLAFEIINYRYINRLPTIISCEWQIGELADIDEATGSRIAERSRDYCMAIGRDKARNYRLSATTTV